jgi:hypothetical protein
MVVLPQRGGPVSKIRGFRFPVSGLMRVRAIFNGQFPQNKKVSRSL